MIWLLVINRVNQFDLIKTCDSFLGSGHSNLAEGHSQLFLTSLSLKIIASLAFDRLSSWLEQVCGQRLNNIYREGHIIIKSLTIRKFFGVELFNFSVFHYVALAIIIFVPLALLRLFSTCIASVAFHKVIHYCLSYLFPFSRNYIIKSYLPGLLIFSFFLK